MFNVSVNQSINQSIVLKVARLIFALQWVIGTADTRGKYSFLLKSGKTKRKLCNCEYFRQAKKLQDTSKEAKTNNVCVKHYGRNNYPWLTIVLYYIGNSKFGTLRCIYE